MTTATPVPPAGPSDERTRFYVSLIFSGLFAILTLAAPFYPAAAAILKEVVVPILAVMVGYLFGQHQRSAEP